MKIKKSTIIDIAIILLTSLISLLWFRKGYIISTPDITIPTTPFTWCKYLYAWNDTWLTGEKWSPGFTALAYNGISALVQFMGFSVVIAQKSEFVFWFALTGLSMYFMLRQLLREEENRIVWLVASNFYMFNLFQEALWGGNQSGVSAYIFIPFAIGLIEYGFRQRAIFKSAFFIGLTSLLCSCMAANHPIFILVIFAVSIFFIVCGVSHCKKGNIKARDMLFFGTAITVCFFAWNMFWILPFYAENLAVIRSDTLPVSKEVASSWLGGISSYTSFVNVVRMQGAWTWYQGWNEPYHVYSTLYKNNWFFIVMSWILPLLVLTGVFLSKKKYKYYFLALAVVGVCFGMGIHKPFTSIYLWMFANIPFFNMFRSPWYKFTLFTCLGYAFFLGLAAKYLKSVVDRILNRTRSGYLKSSLFCVAGIIMLYSMFYAFPVTIGKMYPGPEDRKFLKPAHIKIPLHVWNMADLLNNMDGFFRVMILPKGLNNVYVYKWGYGGLRPVINFFCTKPFLFNQSGGCKEVIEYFQKALYDLRTTSAYKILRMLNAGYVLQENEMEYDYYLKDGDTPEFVKERLGRQRKIEYQKSVDSYDLYKVDGLLPHVYPATKLTLVCGGKDVLIPLCGTDLLDTPSLVFYDDLSGQKRETIKNISDNVGCVVLSDGFSVEENNLFRKQLFENPEVGLCHIISTENMDGRLDKGDELTEDKLKIAKKEGFEEEDVFSDGNTWEWWTGQGEKGNITLVNSTNSEIKANVTFSVYNYGRERSLYFYLNEGEPTIVETKQDSKFSWMVKNLTFKPGENHVRFYSPFACDDRNGKNVRFAFRDFKIGYLSFESEIKIFQRGNYKISVMPFPMDKYINREVDVKLLIDGNAVRLDLNEDKEKKLVSYRVPSYLFEKGRHKVTLPQGDSGCNYYVVIEKESANKTSDGDAVTSYSRINETAYNVDAVNSRPFFLVFSETYNKNWSIYKHGKYLGSPFLINGFANCYFIETTGKQDLEIRYDLQKLFYRGLLISCLSLLVIAAVAVGVKM